MSDSVQIEKHPTERRRVAATTVYGGCCCCLHSLGSLIGAAVAPTLAQNSVARNNWEDAFISGYYDDDPDDAISASPRPVASAVDVPDIRRPLGASSVAVFWRLTAAAVVAYFMVCFLCGVIPDFFASATLFLAFLFPGLQLASVFVTSIVFAVWQRPDQSHQHKLVRRIVSGIVNGTVAGVVALIAAVFFMGFVESLIGK